MSTPPLPVYAHPEDRAALRNLEALPFSRRCVKALMNMSIERLMHGLNMPSKVRLGPRQLPRIYRLLPRACEALGIEEPEFYLEMNPAPNAYTMGDAHTFITVTSGLIESMEEDELEAVVAHECGHIACRHVLYHTMAQYLFLGGRLLGPLAMLTQPVRAALFYWHRRSELSADRAAALVMGSADPVVETMLRLAGGPKSITGEVDLDLYQRQAEAYDKLHESAWDSLLQGAAIMSARHPLAAVRVREIRRWCGTEEFEQMRQAVHSRVAAAARCPDCRNPVDRAWRFCRRCGVEVVAANVQEDRNEAAVV